MTVTSATIATALGVAAPLPDSPLDKQWDMWIDDAMRMITRRATKLAVDIATIDLEDIDYVVREAVVEHARHPEDSTQVSIAVDDGSLSKSYRSGGGRVRILDEWWELLGLEGAGTRQAFTILTAPDCAMIHDETCALTFGALYCSCGADIAGYPLYGTL